MFTICFLSGNTRASGAVCCLVRATRWKYAAVGKSAAAKTAVAAACATALSAIRTPLPYVAIPAGAIIPDIRGVARKSRAQNGSRG